MSREREFALEHDQLGPDAAVWVLGALDEPEAERFARHLDRCVVCRDEVSSLRAVADVLPLSADRLNSPRGLRREIMGAVRAEASDQRTDAARFPRRGGASGRGWGMRPVLAGAVALALVTGAVTAAELSASGTRTQVTQARVTGPGGRAYLELHGARAELVVRDLAPPPLDKIYEVWLKRPGRRRLIPTTALFNVTSNGSGSVDVPGDLRGVTQVLVTPEPLGGSQIPTHAPVIEANV